MDRSEEFQLKDLFKDYESVGLNILDDIYVSFISKIQDLEIDLSEDFPPNYHVYYHHNKIPYLATIITNYFNNKKQLDIKLNNNGFFHNDLPFIRKDICRN